MHGHLEVPGPSTQDKQGDISRTLSILVGIVDAQTKWIKTIQEQVDALLKNNVTPPTYPWAFRLVHPEDREPSPKWR